MRRALVIVLLALLVVVLVPIVGGSLLPEAHVATQSAEFPVAPDSVWKVITDVSAYPAWRTGITASDVVVIRDGLPHWTETSSDGPVTYEATEGEPGRRLVVRIVSEGLPYGGSWTYAITPTVDGGTTLTITENGEVYNPVFRFLSRFVFGHTATIDQYLADLGKRLATPAPAKPPQSLLRS
jgi:uncharacterized protein YndB with AHSA1/START domain